jgi:hypothetical protein
MFDLALTSHNEGSSHIFGEFKLQTINIYDNTSTYKEQNNYFNEKILRKHQLQLLYQQTVALAFALKLCDL